MTTPTAKAKAGTKTKPDLRELLGDENCSQCGNSAKVLIKHYDGKEKIYGPYWDEDGENPACIYCAADDTANAFYESDYEFSQYVDRDYLRELFESGILKITAERRD